MFDGFLVRWRRVLPGDGRPDQPGRPGGRGRAGLLLRPLPHPRPLRPRPPRELGLLRRPVAVESLRSNLAAGNDVQNW